MKKVLIIIITILVIVLGVVLFTKNGNNNENALKNEVVENNNNATNSKEKNEVKKDNNEENKNDKEELVSFEKVEEKYDAKIGVIDNIVEGKVSLTVTNVLMDNKNLAIDLEIKLTDEVVKKYDIKDMTNVSLSDLIILDDKDNFVFTEMPMYPFQDYCLKNNLEDLAERYDEVTEKSTLKLLPRFSITKDNVVKVGYVIEANDLSKVKSLKIHGSKISLFSDNDIDYRAIDIDGEYNFTLDLSNKNTKDSISYIVTDNEEMNQESATMIYVASYNPKSEVLEMGIDLSKQKEAGMFNIEDNDKFIDINKSYVENENGKKINFSKVLNSEILLQNKFNSYDTKVLVKLDEKDLTDTLKVKVNLDGKTYNLTMEKVK